MKIPLIPNDKANHFVYGALVSAIILLVGQGPIAAMSACVIVAAAKEIYDLVTGKGQSSVMDFLWTIFGGAVVTFT